jgi:hypothetical protein
LNDSPFAYLLDFFAVQCPKRARRTTVWFTWNMDVIDPADIDCFFYIFNGRVLVRGKFVIREDFELIVSFSHSAGFQFCALPSDKSCHFPWCRMVADLCLSAAIFNQQNRLIQVLMISRIWGQNQNHSLA